MADPSRPSSVIGAPRQCGRAGACYWTSAGAGSGRGPDKLKCSLQGKASSVGPLEALAFADRPSGQICLDTPGDRAMEPSMVRRPERP